MQSNAKRPRCSQVTTYDVFNGDADGICALHQLRLAQPRDSQLVTGVKRDIALLQRVPPSPEIEVTVLDVSLDSNVAALTRILEVGGRVTYFDHHSAKQAFRHPRLNLTWSDKPDVCTSLLVDEHLNGRYRGWAIAAAFGDNLVALAKDLAARSGFSHSQALVLEELGRAINYNAYGNDPQDLHIAPDVLYRAIQPFPDPLEFIAGSSIFHQLRSGYQDDIARAATLEPHINSPNCVIYVLPDAPWARRISGVFANQLVAQQRTTAFAVLTPSSNRTYAVSVRSGSPNTLPADQFCSYFPTGGGRTAAGGINELPARDFDAFVLAFSNYFSSPRSARASAVAISAEH